MEKIVRYISTYNDTNRLISSWTRDLSINDYSIHKAVEIVEKNQQS